jgi:hypothetical protein
MQSAERFTFDLLACFDLMRRPGCGGVFLSVAASAPRIRIGEIYSQAPELTRRDTKECVRYLPRVKMVLAEFRLCFCEGYRDQGDDA